MAKYKVEILLAAWQDIDKISDFYMKMSGSVSAQRITDQILDTLEKLGDFPYMGAQHPDPELMRREYRKVICGDYVCVYKVIGPSVYVYRVVNGRTDYPKYKKQHQANHARRTGGGGLSAFWEVTHIFIWNFVAGEVLDQLVDWVYGQIVGFLGNFFALMGNMGVELFELEWVEAILLFFSRLAWALFAVSVVVCAFECGIEYSAGKGNLQQTALNIIKGFLAVSLFTVAPVRLYALSVSLQSTFAAGLTGAGRSIGDVGQDIITELSEVQTLADVLDRSHFGLGTLTSPIMLLFCVILMAYAVIKVFFANLKRLIHDGEELTIFSVKQEDLKGFQMEAKRYGVLFCPIVNKVEKTGTVEIMAKAKDAKQINRIFERMGYPAPVKEDTAAKKENARAPSENSSKERGTGARASTEPATEKADARPSVRSRLMALQAAAERDGTAPTKDTVREAIQKAMPTRE